MNLQDQRVMVIRCDRYEVQKIKRLITEGLQPWGGMAAFVKPEQRVLLKVNLLMAKKPEEVTTTHPAMVQAVAELVQAVGGKPVIGDSPGGPFTTALLQRVYRRTGMEVVAQETGAELNWEFGAVERSFPDGKILKTITVGKYIDQADVIINLPKLKTHGMTKMSGAVKNLYGSIPGLLKAEYHLNMQDISDFSNVLCDIALCVAPQLSIMDGIIGMEGEGPSGGTPVHLNTILISPNPFALDVAVAELVRIKQEKIPTIKAAGERGLISRPEEIELMGEPLKNLHPASFESPDINYSAKLLERFLPGALGGAITNLLRPKPIFDADLCVQCGDCIRSCPPQVISKRDKGVEADLSRCIRCFCCQELCPKIAVRVHRPVLGRLLFRK